MPEVKRTLVKSGPELWAELSDPAQLGGHLEPFGSVRITRAEPETLVEWEGERASGAVRLEPSGFGTRVTLTAEPVWLEVPAEPAEEPPPPVTDPDPPHDPTPVGDPPEPHDPSPESDPEPRVGLLARLFRRRGTRRQTPTETTEPDNCRERGQTPLATEAAPAPVEPEPVRVPAIEDEAAAGVLTGTLEAVGMARHRPFSRA